MLGLRSSHVAGTVLALVALGQSTARAEGLQDDIDQATAVIERFKGMPEEGIPAAVLRDAKGLAVLTVLKGGFLFSGQAGWGVVVARTGRGWSGPSAIGAGGAGFGLQIGGQVNELVIVLNTPQAVDAFSRGANVVLGADLSVAAGPVGRDLAAGITPVAAVYTYSRSQGLFAGVSVEGTVLVARDGANREYYGRDASPQEILTGEVVPPSGARKLVQALARYEHGPRA